MVMAMTMATYKQNQKNQKRKMGRRGSFDFF
jgi:hypothetical protein